MPFHRWPGSQPGTHVQPAAPPLLHLGDPEPRREQGDLGAPHTASAKGYFNKVSVEGKSLAQSLGPTAPLPLASLGHPESAAVLG